MLRVCISCFGRVLLFFFSTSWLLHWRREFGWPELRIDILHFVVPLGLKNSSNPLQFIYDGYDCLAKLLYPQGDDHVIVKWRTVTVLPMKSDEIGTLWQIPISFLRNSCSFLHSGQFYLILREWPIGHPHSWITENLWTNIQALGS